MYSIAKKWPDVVKSTNWLLTEDQQNEIIKGTNICLQKLDDFKAGKINFEDGVGQYCDDNLLNLPPIKNSKNEVVWNIYRTQPDLAIQKSYFLEFHYLLSIAHCACYSIQLPHTRHHEYLTLLQPIGCNSDVDICKRCTMSLSEYILDDYREYFWSRSCTNNTATKNVRFCQRLLPNRLPK